MYTIGIIVHMHSSVPYKAVYNGLRVVNEMAVLTLLLHIGVPFWTLS